MKSKFIAWKCFKAYGGRKYSWQLSPRNVKSEFQSTVILSQIAIKANISYQFLPVNAILGRQMPPNPFDFSSAFSSDRIKTKQNARKASESTESL